MVVPYTHTCTRTRTCIPARPPGHPLAIPPSVGGGGGVVSARGLVFSGGSAPSPESWAGADEAAGPERAGLSRCPSPLPPGERSLPVSSPCWALGEGLLHGASELWSGTSEHWSGASERRSGASECRSGTSERRSGSSLHGLDTSTDLWSPSVSMAMGRGSFSTTGGR